MILFRGEFMSNYTIGTDKYTKIVYQTNPIGPEKIILYLTTFDIEKFKEDESLKKMPTKQIRQEFEISNLNISNSARAIEINEARYDLLYRTINAFVNDIYAEQIHEMEKCIEYLRSIKIVPVECSNVKNITNSDCDIHCDTVKGNIVNCNNIYCNEIKGNVVNCDKIVYK